MPTFSVLRPDYIFLKFERGQNWDNKAINGSVSPESSLEESSEPKSEMISFKKLLAQEFCGDF